MRKSVRPLERQLSKIQPAEKKADDAELYRQVVHGLSESEQAELCRIIVAIEKHGPFTADDWRSFLQALPSTQQAVVEKVERLFQTVKVKLERRDRKV